MINGFDIDGAAINGSADAGFMAPIFKLTYLVPVELSSLAVPSDQRQFSIVYEIRGF